MLSTGSADAERAGSQNKAVAIAANSLHAGSAGGAGASTSAGTEISAVYPARSEQKQEQEQAREEREEKEKEVVELRRKELACGACAPTLIAKLRAKPADASAESLSRRVPLLSKGADILYDADVRRACRAADGDRTSVLAPLQPTSRRRFPRARLF